MRWKKRKWKCEIVQLCVYGIVQVIKAVVQQSSAVRRCTLDSAAERGGGNSVRRILVRDLGKGFLES